MLSVSKVGQVGSFLIWWIILMGIFSVSMGEFSDKMKIENCWKTVIGRAAERDVLIVS